LPSIQAASRHRTTIDSLPPPLSWVFYGLAEFLPLDTQMRDGAMVRALFFESFRPPLRCSPPCLLRGFFFQMHERSECFPCRNCFSSCCLCLPLNASPPQQGLQSVLGPLPSDICPCFVLAHLIPSSIRQLTKLGHDSTLCGPFPTIPPSPMFFVNPHAPEVSFQIVSRLPTAIGVPQCSLCAPLKSQPFKGSRLLFPSPMLPGLHRPINPISVGRRIPRVLGVFFHPDRPSEINWLFFFSGLIFSHCLVNVRSLFVPLSCTSRGHGSLLCISNFSTS